MREVTIQEKLTPKLVIRQLEELRSKGFDISLAEHLANEFGTEMSLAKYYNELGLEPHRDTLNLILDKDESYRWIVPEIIRDSIYKGFINAPIHRDFIAREENVSQVSVTMPFFDMTGLDNAPKSLGVAESMELGTLKYGQKQARIYKSGIGIEVADECMRYSSISMLSLFLQDVGIKLASRLSALAVQCLISGEQADSSESAASIGVTTQNTLAYKDFIRMFVRGSLINRRWTKTIGDEDTINDMLNLAEFRRSDKSGQPEMNLNVKTPVPNSLDAYCHSSMPTKKLLMVDQARTMVQLTSVPLNVESERIVQRQVNGTYVSLTTGFAIIFRDGRIILDYGTLFNANQWPAYMAPKY